MAYYTNNKVDGVDVISESDLEAIETAFANMDTDKADKASPTLTTPTLTSPDINGSATVENVLIEDVLTHSATSEDGTIDCSTGNYFYLTATGNITFTFGSVPSNVYIMVIELTNGGAHTIAYPAAVRFPSDIEPTLTSSGTDLLVFVTRDGGTSWHAQAAMIDV